MSIVNEPNGGPKPLRSIRGEPECPARPRRRLWRRRGFWFLLALMGFVTFGIGNFAYRRHLAEEKLREVVADMDRTDPGWRLHDIEAARAVVPETENSAVVVAEAFRWLPQGWPSREVSDRFANLTPQEQLDAEDLGCLRNDMAETEIALREARKLAALMNGRNRITYKRDFISTLLPDLQNARAVFALLNFDVLLQAQDGDLKGALRSCRALLNTARSIGDEPLLISQLVRLAGVLLGCQAAERVLAQGEPDPDDLLALQKLLEEEERFPRLLVGVRGERAAMHELFDALECGDASLNDVIGTPHSWSDRVSRFAEPDYVLAQHPIFLALENELVRIAALPPHERPGPLRVLEATAQSQPSALIRRFLPAVSKIDEAARRTDGNLRCLIAALAAERYRRQHGRWPGDLGQLVPEFLPTVPLDPEDGEPLRFHRRPDRVVVYSAMKKHTTGVGLQSYDPEELSPPGVGVAVHLFDVPQRRQPPRPKPVVVGEEPK